MGPHWSLTGVRGVAAAALVVPQREPVDRVAGDGGDAAEDLRARDALGLGVGVDPLGEVARPEAPHVGEGQLGGRRAPAACNRPRVTPRGGRNGPASATAVPRQRVLPRAMTAAAPCETVCRSPDLTRGVC